MGNLGAQKEKRNDTPISAKKDIMGDKTVRVRADLHHIIKMNQIVKIKNLSGIIYLRKKNRMSIYTILSSHAKGAVKDTHMGVTQSENHYNSGKKGVFFSIVSENLKHFTSIDDYNQIEVNGKIIIENILLNNSRRSILKFQKYDVPILLCVFFLTLASIFISNIYFNLLIILLIPFLLVIFYKEDRIYMSKISFISGSIFGLVNVLNNTFSIVYSQRHSISSLIDFGNNLFLMLTTICLNIILMMIITNIYFYIQKTYIFILSVLIIVGIPTQKKVMNLKKELNKYE